MIRSMLLRGLCLALVVLAGGPAPTTGQEASLPNPYFETTRWRLWRENDAAVHGLRAFVPPAKAPPATIEPAPAEKRLWPSDREPGKALAYGHEPSERYAGTWDDVYASWSGTHGYVRNEWQGSDGSRVAGVKDSIIHLVDLNQNENVFRVGINFFHQSTTGMGHSVANGYLPGRTEAFERIYFADGLITAPAHASYTEGGAGDAARTSDLYMALFPTYFNSVGSSNSETMAITKMILAGGYLSPETKTRIKQNGLYPATMLAIWKHALPVDAPYESEWKQRIAYKAVGDRFAYPGKYGAAGIARGDICLPYHRYDDTEHMRRMVEIAKDLDTAPPEAILGVKEHEGGTLRFALKKTVLVVQEEGEDVSLVVSAKESFGLAGRPLSFRWKLLYGTPGTTVRRIGEEPVWRIEVPWDGSLPEGRTTLVLVADDGSLQGNPAAVNVYRKKGDLPGNGTGPGTYGYDGRFANRRPVLAGLQDAVVAPGGTVRLPLRAIDPEGFPVRYAKRSSEPGAFDGNLYAWDCPRDAKPGDRIVTIIGSDQTSGNGYEGRRLRIRVAPKVHARIHAERWVGAAPMTLELSAKGSIGAKKFSWAIEPRAPGPPKMPKATLEGPTVTHEFAKPGIYTVWLTAEGDDASDTGRTTVYVTDGKLETAPTRLTVSGNGVGVPDGAGSPNPFDHTHFGTVADGESAERTFLIANRGGGEIRFVQKAVTVEGDTPGEFEVVKPPRDSIGPGGSTAIRIRFSPKGPGLRSAVVRVRGGGGEMERSFSIAGESLISQERIDAAAAPTFSRATSLLRAEEWEKGIEALREIVKRWPASTQAGEARLRLEKLESDPAVAEAIEARRAAEAEKKAQAERDAAAKQLYDLARNFEMNGMKEKAREIYRRVVEEYPNSPWAEKAAAGLD